MEGNGLTAQTIELLSQHWTAVGHAAAGAAGREVSGRLMAAMSALSARVKEKFAKKHTAEPLSGLEQSPQSGERQTMVSELLAAFVAADPKFARELRELVDAALQAGGDTIVQSVSVSESTVGDITQVGKRSPG